MTTFDPAIVKRRVREQREKAGLSLSQLAATSGLTKAYLVRLENQGGNPTIEALASIADALDITVADLIDAPKIALDQSTIKIPQSLRAYADEFRISTVEIRMLASIKWRNKGEEPRTPQRWRYIHESITASRAFDQDGKLSD